MISKDKIDELKKKYGIIENVRIEKDIMLTMIIIQHEKWSINYSFYIYSNDVKKLHISHPFECKNLNNILLFLKEVSEGKE